MTTASTRVSGSTNIPGADFGSSHLRAEVRLAHISSIKKKVLVQSRTRTQLDQKIRTQSMSKPHQSESTTHRKSPRRPPRPEKKKNHPSSLGDKVQQAKGLMGRSQRSCDSFVTLTVTSDLHQCLSGKTQTVTTTRNPDYNRRFSLRITDRLMLCRLLVSVYRRSADHRCRQLIGCMSFGIGSLVLSCKLVSDWFFLLGKECGRSKHLRVKPKHGRPIRTLRRAKARPGQEMFWKSSALLWDASTHPHHQYDFLSAAGSTPEPEPEQHREDFGSSVPTRSSNVLHKQEKSHTLDLQHLHKSTANTGRMTVRVTRGNNGFGFTICCDAPVRVQAVETGGPAHQAGLCQGDSVLQLNGIPVETWKCVDLAHAIRSCSSHIVLVLWRKSQESKVLRDTAPHADVRHSFLWRDEKVPQQEFSIHTLKGTRVTSSNGDNYIFLSPVSHGGAILQSCLQECEDTVGRLYQTHPIKGQQLLRDLRPQPSHQPYSSHTAMLPPPTSALSAKFSNYQNCTMVQSHRPSSRYSSFISPKPQTLIFPVFIQPVDLCSSDRTLLLSENMMLQPTQQLPTKVTVFVYTDLLLLTTADSVGRFLVLQTPLFLDGLQLREVSSEPLRLYLLQSSASGWRCVVCLEAFSIEQKIRVSLCLHDNMQLVAPETNLCPQVSTLPLHLPPPSADLLPEPHPFHSDRKNSKEEEELQQGQGQSRCEKRQSHLHTLNDGDSDEDKPNHKPTGLHRSLSEGSLLKEPRSPRFLSDSSIHRLTCPLTSDPSPHTVRKQLTRTDGTLKELLLLFNNNNNNKGSECNNVKLKRKNLSVSVDVRGRLSFLRKRNNSRGFHGNSLDRALRNNRPSLKEVLKWAESFDALLANQYGVAVFRYFLRSEFSEENLDFWLAVEGFKQTRPLKMEAHGQRIYREFISADAPRQVNVDSFVRESTNQSVRHGVGPTSFDQAQEQVFNLMMSDSYPRFLKSHLYTTLTNQSTVDNTVDQA
ncbi:regulator of G-protein signaling 3-like isoform X3 [Gouania willdenowi]|uniref:regulator of G-protein signaling 3-like isoform X3 n=1 Tax=Gouania willdenowi TaxID=441366 RepID=UPI0010553691|nr:regulator of G-protein signaling 3-like isoform X3 [Gouania willdenowi]